MNHTVVSSSFQRAPTRRIVVHTERPQRFVRSRNDTCYNFNEKRFSRSLLTHFTKNVSISRRASIITRAAEGGEDEPKLPRVLLDIIRQKESLAAKQTSSAKTSTPDVDNQEPPRVVATTKKQQEEYQAKFDVSRQVPAKSDDAAVPLKVPSVDRDIPSEDLEAALEDAKKTVEEANITAVKAAFAVKAKANNPSVSETSPEFIQAKALSQAADEFEVKAKLNVAEIMKRINEENEEKNISAKNVQNVVDNVDTAIDSSSPKVEEEVNKPKPKPKPKPSMDKWSAFFNEKAKQSIDKDVNVATESFTPDVKNVTANIMESIVAKNEDAYTFNKKVTTAVDNFDPDIKNVTPNIMESVVSKNQETYDVNKNKKEIKGEKATPIQQVKSGKKLADEIPKAKTIPKAQSIPKAQTIPKSNTTTSKKKAKGEVLLAADVPGFTFRRLGIFACILVGYSCYYLTRNSLTFTAPVLVADKALGLDITAIGLVTSIFPLCYGCSKFISGTLSDVLSPRLMLGGGLLLTGIVNCAFGASSSLTLFCTLWAMNGLLQGFGAPSCAKILTAWFATKERGTYWGMWNIAHNLGGFGAPILAGNAARALGWRFGLFAPGSIAIVVGIILLIVCRASPEAAGYPPVELPEKQALAAANEVEEEEEEEEQLSVKDNLIQNVLSNPYIWGLALTYFCVYIVRQGVTSWSVFYLMKEKAVVDVAAAATRVAGLELGGLCGSLIAGRLSDSLIAANKDKGAVGQRIRVVMMYLVGVGVSLLAFKAVPADSALLQAASVFMLGFFLYGPQMLIGLCGAEIVGRKSVGASEGFLGWVAYLGAANAGAPLSILVRKFGWSAFFTTLVGASIVGICLLIPLMNAKSFVQREEDKAKLALA